MHIERIGQGPPLVLIHGWAMHSGIFAPLSDRLSDEFTLYLVDLPGHGRSRSDPRLDLAHCVADIAAQTPPAAWLGWSLGGLFALHAAQTLPQQVNALIMLSATPRFVTADDWPNGVRPTLFSGFADALRQDYRAALEHFLALEAFGSDHMRDELRQLRAQLFDHGEPDPSVLVDGLRLLADTDLRAGLLTLACPSLWLGGRRDRLVNWDAMRAAAAQCPHATPVRIESAGHAPFLSHADEVASAIRALLTDRVANNAQ